MESPPWTSDVDMTKELFEEFEKLKLQNESQHVLVLHDYEKWEDKQRSCKREKKVIALEITNQFSGSSARARPLFDRLAREFPSVCVRVILNKVS